MESSTGAGTMSGEHTGLAGLGAASAGGVTLPLMERAVEEAVAAAGFRAVSARAIGSGAAGSVWRVLTGGGSVVVKVSEGADLRAEGRSLGYLREVSALPVPRVHHAAERVLVMEDMPGTAGGAGAEEHAAGLLAALHGVTGPRYGLGFDNTIGPLRQENGWLDSWPAFFRERRLMPMALAAAREGAFPVALADALEHLGARLGELVPEGPAASLIHGDVWSGNVLSVGGVVTAFVDPAPYHAHAEVELAFMTLFSTFGPRFFEAYQRVRPIDPEFWAVRRDVYNLYPLLVHARLFRGHYVAQLESTVRRFL